MFLGDISKKNITLKSTEIKSVQRITAKISIPGDKATNSWIVGAGGLLSGDFDDLLETKCGLQGEYQ